jgi:hypothetical protein
MNLTPRDLLILTTMFYLAPYVAWTLWPVVVLKALEE